MMTAMQYGPMPASWQESPPRESEELSADVDSGRSGKKCGLNLGWKVFAGAPLVPGPVVIGERGEAQAV